jgi:hypothetical protein
MSQVKLKDPLDGLFDVDPDERELVEYEDVPQTELAALAPPGAAAPEKDEDDIETERKIDEVYDHAVTTFQNQIAYTEIIEPRYAARNAEVAASYLNIALSAATAKAKLKTDRRRVNSFIPGMGGKVTNNTIVATREEIMRMISVDAEAKPI